MNAVTRLVAWLRSSDRGQADRPGTDQQFTEWLNRETATDRTTRKVLDALRGRESVLDALDQQMVALQLHDVSEAVTTPLRLVDVLTAAARWRAEVTAQRELLGVLWLYVDWRYVTRQLTTEQKNLWADAVDAFGDPDDAGPKAERWWTA